MGHEWEARSLPSQEDHQVTTNPYDRFNEEEILTIQKEFNTFCNDANQVQSNDS